MTGLPTPPARVSVIICAYTGKRWDDTLAAVASVREQSLAAHETIVVVDHNRALYERLQAELPDVTVLENCEQQGLSGGRNTGVSAAQGEIVAFLDDDAVAEHDWLKFLVEPYAEPAVAGVGGLTLPRWDTKRPSWFPREFDWVIGCTHAGMPDWGAPTAVRNLHGGNASFRRTAFDLAGGFINGLGRSGRGLPGGGEETEFCIRLSQREPGCVLLFDHRAVVWHRVGAERCRLSYFTARCYAEGLSKALVTRSVGTADGLAAERSHALTTLPRAAARGLADVAHRDAAGAGRSAAIVVGLAAAATGYLVGAARGGLR